VVVVAREPPWSSQRIVLRIGLRRHADGKTLVVIIGIVRGDGEVARNIEVRVAAVEDEHAGADST
jgi:hypothetical protein